MMIAVLPTSYSCGWYYLPERILVKLDVHMLYCKPSVNISCYCLDSVIKKGLSEEVTNT